MARRRKGPTLIQRSRAVSPEQKAVYHVVAGAGKKRVIRDFFDMNPQDEAEIVRLLGSRIDERLRRG